MVPFTPIYRHCADVHAAAPAGPNNYFLAEQEGGTRRRRRSTAVGLEDVCPKKPPEQLDTISNCIQLHRNFKLMKAIDTSRCTSR